MIKSFVFFRSFFDSARNLSAKYRLEIYDAICFYALEGVIIEMSPKTKALFILMKPNMDSSAKKYRAAQENGKKGGRPKKSETKPKQNLNVDSDVDVDVDVDSDSAPASDAVRIPAESPKATFLAEETEEAEEASKTTAQRTYKDEKPVAVLPLLDGGEYPVYQSDADAWQPTRPGIDIVFELRRMVEWSKANPKKIKSREAIAGFINGWLDRAYKERGENAAYVKEKTPAVSQSDTDWNEFWEAACNRGEDPIKGW